MGTNDVIKLVPPEVARLISLCRDRSVEGLTAALHCLHCTLRAVGREDFAVEVVLPCREDGGTKARDEVITVPFRDNDHGGETLEDLNRRWKEEACTHVLELGFDCDVDSVLVYDFEGNTEERSTRGKRGVSAGLDADALEEEDDSKVRLIVTWYSDGAVGGLAVAFQGQASHRYRLRERYEQVLYQLIEGKARLEALLPDERDRVLAWGKGEERALSKMCLHDLIGGRFEEQPDAVALIDKNGSLSMNYAALDAKSLALAIHLQRRGVRPENFVGLLMDKGFNAIVAMLGILRAGGAYVPLDPGYPTNRLKYIVEDSGIDILVTQRKHRDMVHGLRAKALQTVVCVEDVSNDEDDEPLSLARLVKPENMAYLIYTSGTTGNPKGVVCTHRGATGILQSSVEWYQEHGRPGKDVLGLTANLVFDASIVQVASSLGAGLTLSIDMKGCTMLDGTPSLAAALLEDPTNEKVHSLVVGGEACPHGMADRCRNFCNEYGPTETTINATRSTSSDTIGAPLPNVLCYIVRRDDLALCPPGVPGELLIGGIGVSRRYHNQPDLTAQKFIKNPFAHEGRVYRSGDKVKWNEEGELVFLGRFDHQVKVRGNRIELGEVEAALMKHDCIREAVAVARDDRLVAFVVMSQSLSKGADEESLKESLASDSGLPRYMIPWRIVAMEQFPLTRNGKVDRLALPMPDPNEVSGAPFAAPKTRMETFLCKLFEELLPVDQVGIHDDFTDLGGHSLLAMRAVGRIRSECGAASFSARSFLSFRTPSLLAESIHSMGLSSDSGGDGDDSTSASEVINQKDGSFSKSHTNRRPTDKTVADELWDTEDVRAPVSGDWCRIAYKAVAICILSVTLSVSLLPAVILAELVTKDTTSSPLWMYEVKFLLMLCAVIVCMTLLLVFFTWCLGKILLLCIGKKKSIIFRDSPEYLAWYIFDRLWFLTGNMAVAAFGSTVWLPWIYNMFGAEVGIKVFIEDSFVRVPFLLSIGDRSIVETEATLKTVFFHLDGSISFDTIKIESDTVVGAHSVLGIGCRVKQSVWVKALSKVEDGTTIPEHSTVQGTVQYASDQDLQPSEPPSSISFWWSILAPLITSMPHFFAIAFYAGVIPVALFQIQRDWNTTIFTYFLGFPIIRVLGQTLVALLIIPIRLALHGGRVQPCSTEVYSPKFCRHWAASKLYQARRGSKIGSIFTKYLSSYLFGARLDFQAPFLLEPEEPDLTSSGTNLFCGGDCKMRNASFEPAGKVVFNRIQVGNGNMILDRSVIEAGTKLGNGNLVGSLTLVPKATADPNGQLLLGNPLIAMTRNSAGTENDQQEEKLSVRLQLLEFIIMEYFLLTLFIPFDAAIVGNIAIITKVQSYFSFAHSFAITIGTVPLTMMLLLGWFLMVAFLTKRLVVGNFADFSKGSDMIPLNSWKMCKWRLVWAITQKCCSLPLKLVDDFVVTRRFWSLMGATIGEQTMIDPGVLIYEADLLSIGENCRIENKSTLLCDKLSNGGLEIFPINIPSNTFVGTKAVILPGVRISGNGVKILPLTHAMTDEELSNGIWHGSPAELMVDPIV